MVTKVAMDRGFNWIKEGVGMVIERPGPWIGGWAATFGVGLVLNLIPVLGSLLAQVLNFVMSLFFLCYADAQHRGIEFDFDSYFERGKGQVSRLVLVALLGVVFFILAAVPFLGSMLAAGGTEFFTAQAKAGGSAPSMTSIVIVAIGGALSGILAVFAFAGMAFTTPLILFQDKSVGDALEMSLRGVMKNLPAMIFYSIVVSIFLVICALPLGLGLLLGFPAMSASFYLIYQEILGKPEAL